MKKDEQIYLKQQELTNNLNWKLETDLRFVQKAEFEYWNAFRYLGSDHMQVSKVIRLAMILRTELENAAEKATKLEASLNFFKLSGDA